MARGALGSAIGINSNSFYDSKSGLSISVTLALTLSWIPLIGPMVAGFVGGRRAGSISRGFLIGVGGCLIVFVISFLMNLGLSQLFKPEYHSFIDGIESFAPIVVMVLESLSSYLSANFVAVGPGLSISVPMQTYASVFAFALIGGVFADQVRKELRIIVSHTEEVNRPKPHRSVTAFLEGHELGFQTYGDLTKMNVNAGCASTRNDTSVLDFSGNNVPPVAESARVELASPEVVISSTSSSYVTLASSDNVSDAVPKVESAVPGTSAQKPVASRETVVQKKDVQEPGSLSDDMEWF